MLANVLCKIIDSLSSSLKNKILVLYLSVSIKFHLFELPAAKKIKTNSQTTKKRVVDKTTVATTFLLLCVYCLTGLVTISIHFLQMFHVRLI